MANIPKKNPGSLAKLSHLAALSGFADLNCGWCDDAQLIVIAGKLQ
jgi:hypothetical protein